MTSRSAAQVLFLVSTCLGGAPGVAAGSAYILRCHTDFDHGAFFEELVTVDESNRTVQDFAATITPSDIRWTTTNARGELRFRTELDLSTGATVVTFIPKDSRFAGYCKRMKAREMADAVQELLDDE